MVIDNTVKARSLLCSIWDGIFYSILLGFGESFFSVFAIALGATDLVLSLLSSLPMMLGSLSQLLSSQLIILFKSRKRFVLMAALLQSLSLIPVIIIAVLNMAQPLLYLITICFYWLFCFILGPAWSSWMGDLVDDDKRGSYFGKRNRICGIIAFISFTTAGIILQYIKQATGEPIKSFTVLFIVAVLARFVSIFFLSRQVDPPYNPGNQVRIGILDFLRKVGRSNFGSLILFLCLMNFSVNISAPFFAPYMIRELKFNYLTYTIINSTILIVKYLFMPVWGRAMDKYGTKKVITLCGFILPVLPLLWLICHDVYTLVLLHIFSGFTWAGFELAAFNFLFDATTKEERVAYLSYYNAFNGIYVFLGALLGGFVVGHFTFLGSLYTLTFLISGIFRLIVSLIFLSRVNEVRVVEHISYKNLLLLVLTALPSRGFVNKPVLFPKKPKQHADK